MNRLQFGAVVECILIDRSDRRRDQHVFQRRTALQHTGRQGLDAGRELKMLDGCTEREGIGSDARHRCRNRYVIKQRTTVESVLTDGRQALGQNDVLQLIHLIAQIAGNTLHTVAYNKRSNLRTGAVERCSVSGTDGASLRQPCDRGRRVTLESRTSNGSHGTWDRDLSQFAEFECPLVDGLQTLMQGYIR